MVEEMLLLHEMLDESIKEELLNEDEGDIPWFDRSNDTIHEEGSY